MSNMCVVFARDNRCESFLAQDATRIMMRELVGFMEFVTDGIRGKLAYTRARGERGSQEPREKINPVRLTKNMTYMFEALLALCGFVEDVATGVWSPTSVDAVTLLLGPEATPLGVNCLKRTWFFSRLALDQHCDRAGIPRVVQIEPLDCCDRTVYERAQAVLGDEATDDEGRLFPAWMLQNKFEDKLLCSSPLDPRVRAYAEVLKPTVRVHVGILFARGHGREVPMGAEVHVEYDVQLMKRTPEVPSARAEPLFFASAEAGLAALPGL
jgi:hypothetical protein